MEGFQLAIAAIKAHKLRTALFLLALAAIITALVMAGSYLHEKLTIQTIEVLVKRYGYFLILFLVFLGNIGIPVPEETTVLASGFAAQQGWLDYKILLIICITTAIIGDNVGYLIGYRGGRKLILRYGRYFGVNEKRLVKFEHFFEKYGDKTVFFARFIAGLRFMAGPLSGAARMPFRRFFLFNAMGAVVWVIVMTQIGYHFGQHLPKVLSILGKTNFTIAVIAIIIVAFVIHRRRQRKESVQEG